MDARRREVASLSPADQQDLLRKHERFVALPAAEQQRLRELQAEIDADPEAERLRKVLAGYHEWLKTLTAGERAELAAKPPAERVQHIQKIMRRQEMLRRNDLLTRHDKREVSHWIEDVLWRQREQLIAGMDSRRQKWFEEQGRDGQRRALVYEAIEKSRRNHGESRVDITEDDVARLAQQLSDGPKAELAKQADLDGKRNIVGGWVFSSWIERMDYGRGPRRPAPLPEADVAQFFESELPAPKREELMGLPQNEAREQLRRMYWDRGKRGSFFHEGRPGRSGSRGGGSRGDRPRPDGKYSDRDRHGPGGPRPGGPRPDGPPPNGRQPRREEGTPPDDGNAPPKPPVEGNHPAAAPA